VELLGENVRKEEKSARNIDQLKEINLFHPRLGSAAFAFNKISYASFLTNQLSKGGG
jgi:hypothetical protein